MFGHDTLNYGNISNLLMAENRIFKSTTPNVIGKIAGGGSNAGKERYAIMYADAIGTLNGRQWASLSEAIADATSGIRSYSTTYVIDSYWKKDVVLALANTTVLDCSSENRNNASVWRTGCGSCLSGFTEDASGVCVADEIVITKDCPSENREDGADDTVCGICLNGYTEDASGVCVADEVGTGAGTETGTGTETSKDCPKENREDGADDTECGVCLSGFTEDVTGVCVADVVTTEEESEDSKKWILLGSVGIICVAGYFAMNG